MLAPPPGMLCSCIAEQAHLVLLACLGLSCFKSLCLLLLTNSYLCTSSPCHHHHPLICFYTQTPTCPPTNPHTDFGSEDEEEEEEGGVGQKPLPHVLRAADALAAGGIPEQAVQFDTVRPCSSVKCSQLSPPNPHA